MLKRQNRRVLCWSIFLTLLTVFHGSSLPAAEQMHEEEKKEINEVRKEANDTLRAIKNYSIDKKDEVMAEARDILDKMDVKIDKLERQSSEKWQDMSEASREKSQQALRELRQKRNEIAEWYGGMKQSSSEAWDEMKKGFIKSYQSLQKAYDKASEKF